MTVTPTRLTAKPEILYSVKAQRGPTLRCKGWKQETILRMLENNMENAEHPERLIIYGGIGKAPQETIIYDGDSDQEAQAELQKKQTEKQKKGYVVVGSNGDPTPVQKKRVPSR